MIKGLIKIKGIYLDEKSLCLEQKRRNAFLRHFPNNP
jgi:hypothetical protein